MSDTNHGTTTERRCRECGSTKPLHCFYLAGRGKRATRCRDCVSIRDRERRESMACRGASFAPNISDRKAFREEQAARAREAERDREIAERVEERLRQHREAAR